MYNLSCFIKNHRYAGKCSKFFGWKVLLNNWKVELENYIYQNIETICILRLRENSYITSNFVWEKLDNSFKLHIKEKYL